MYQAETVSEKTDADEGMYHVICNWCWPESVPGMQSICGLTDQRGDCVTRAENAQKDYMHCVVCQDLEKLDRCPKCNGPWW